MLLYILINCVLCVYVFDILQYDLIDMMQYVIVYFD